MYKIILLIFLICGNANIAYSKDYIVYLSRVADNLYKTTNGIIIKTEYCYEYAIDDKALLTYEPYSFSNKIIFIDSGDSCDVETVLN